MTLIINLAALDHGTNSDRCSESAKDKPQEPFCLRFNDHQSQRHHNHHDAAYCSERIQHEEDSLHCMRKKLTQQSTAPTYQEFDSTLAQCFGKGSIVRNPRMWCHSANLSVPDGFTWQRGQGSFLAYSMILSAAFNVRSKVLWQLWHLNLHVVHR